MCGILGVFSKDSEEPIASHRLWHMIDAMKSRGPDGQHIWSHPGVSLGHLRLSILDLDVRSDQPMVDPQSGRVITFNGEIYNYLELKHELLALGYLFETTSDTEVILKAYDAWGADCLNKFNGMWALAIYDPKEDTLFCARDRFGVKPFVYATSSEHLVFASESKAIVAGFPQFQKPDPDFLRYFVETGQFANTTATFYQPIQNLLPAHYFRVQRGEVPRPVRYWQWTPQVIQPVPSFGDAKDQFSELFKSAVSLRFRSDVPVGVCLSGGLDSTSVVATATQLFQKPIQTFSCIYPEFPEIDESKFIKQSVAKYQCESHTTAPVFDNFLELMTQSVWEQDGPTGGPTVLSQRSVMSLAKDYVTVLLDGQGGDEVLGGYHTYFPYSLQSLMREQLVAPSPFKWLRYWQGALAIQQRTGNKPSKIKQKSSLPVQFQVTSYTTSLLEMVSPYGMDDLNTKMLEDLLMKLPMLLHYEDRNSMAFSLESRLPFLDYRLVEFAFSLPHSYKIHEAKTKRLLVETMKDALPREILARKDKMGYETPGQNWFQGAETQLALQRFLHTPPPVFESLPPVFKETLETLWQQCVAGVPLHSAKVKILWRYFTACIWWEKVAGKNSPRKSMKTDSFLSNH